MFADRPLYPQHAVEVPNPKADVLRISGGVFGTLIILIIINIILLNLTDKSVHARKFMWGVLDAQTTAVDTLIVGDSTGWPGADETLADEILGGGALNFSTNANWGIMDDAWFAQAYIDNFGPPERIVVINAPWAYTASMPDGWIEKLPQTGYAYSQEFRETFYEPEEQRQIAINHAFAFNTRQTERKQLVNDPQTIPLSAQQIMERDLAERLTINYEADVVLDNAQRVYDQYYKGQTFRVSPQAEYTLNHLLKIANQYDIPLYIVTPPHLDQLTENSEEFQAYYAAYEAYFTQWAGANPNVYVTPIDYYDASLLVDLYHVDFEGRELFSTTLFENILTFEE